MFRKCRKWVCAVRGNCFRVDRHLRREKSFISAIDAEATRKNETLMKHHYDHIYVAASFYFLKRKKNDRRREFWNNLYRK